MSNKSILSGENGAPSSMRFSFILVSVGVFILLCAAAFYLVLSALRPEALGEPSWEAIGVFCIGLGGIITGAGWSKTKQKEIERHEG